MKIKNLFTISKVILNSLLNVLKKYNVTCLVKNNCNERIDVRKRRYIIIQVGIHGVP